MKKKIIARSKVKLLGGRKTSVSVAPESRLSVSF